MRRISSRIQVGGTLIPNQHVYIARPEDDVLFDLLLKREFCSVLTSRQMGKSSLMIATAAKLRERGVAVTTFDISGELGNAPDQEMAWRTIIDKIATDLGLDSGLDPDQWWESQPEGTNNRKLLRFFRDVVGRAIPGPVVIFFDEIDATLRLPYGDDLLTALRTMYNERGTEEAYARLTFCVVGVATPNELVKDPRTTAYNIGTDVQLRDFDPARDDLSALQAVLDDDPERARPLLERILYWTGGHPYLTLKLSRDLAGKTPADVDAYAETSFSDLAELRNDSHFQGILRFIMERVTEGEAAVTILGRIIHGHPEPDRPTLAHAQLKLSGLVKPNRRSELVIRNPIYARLFDAQWLRSLAPKRKMIWLRRYALAATAVVVLAAGVYFYYRGVALPRTVAREYQRKLQTARFLREAKEYRAILSGERPDPVSGITLRGHGAEADRQYRGMSETWRAVRHARALELIGAGEIERGLVLGAYIAEELDRPIDPVFEKEYEKRGYDALITTLRSGVAFDPGLAVSGDGHAIVVGNVLWRESGESWRAWSIGAGGGVNAVAFGPGGLYTGDDQGAIKRWRLRENGSPVEELVDIVDGRVLDLAVAPDGAVATIAANSDIPESLHRRTRVTALITSQSPTAIAFANDGRTIVAAAGGVLQVHLPRGRLTYSSPDRSEFRDVAVSASGMLAVAESRSVGLFARIAPLRPERWIEHVPPVRSVAFSDAQKLLATVSDQGVRVFDLATLRDLELPLGEGIDARGSNAQAVAFDDRQGRLVVRRRDDVQLWRVGSAQKSAGKSRLAEWQRKFALRVSTTEEIERLIE